MLTTVRPQRARTAVGALVALVTTFALMLGPAAPAVAVPDTLSGQVSLGAPDSPAGEREVRVTLFSYGDVVLAEVLTDIDGRYRFEHLAWAAYGLEFTYLGSEDFATRSKRMIVSPGSTDYVVPDGVRLTGHVDLDVAGTPAQGIVVSLLAPGATSGIRTTTDLDGDYDFGLVPRGDQRLMFDVRWGAGTTTLYYLGHGVTGTAPGSPPATIDIAGDTVIDAVVSSGPGITGVVRDSAGRPIAGIHATLHEGGRPVASTTTDATGRYWFRAVGFSQHYVRFWSDDLDDGYPAYSGLGWPDLAAWDPGWVGIRPKPYDPDAGFDATLYKYSQITVQLEGPGAVNGQYGDLIVELRRWNDSEGDWDSFSMTNRVGALESEFRDLLPGLYLLTIQRPANPYFATVQATGYIEEGDFSAFSLWLKNPMTAQLLTFADVPPSHPFSSEIEWLYRARITRGTVEADGTRNYYPAQSISRAAMAAFLYRAAGEPAFTPPSTPSFADVPTDFPFYTEIEWMKSVGITTGTRSGGTLLYQPSADVIRRDMAAFLYRAAGSPASDAPSTAPFTDTPPGSQFVREIAWLKSEHISTGNADGSFSPAAPVHRAAMAAFLSRMLTR